MARKRTNIVKLQLRLPATLWRYLIQTAKYNRRSMNAEILSRIALADTKNGTTARISDEIMNRLDTTLLHGNLVALLREHIEHASSAAATKATALVVLQLNQIAQAAEALGSKKFPLDLMNQQTPPRSGG